jgi:hypothetical protein
VPEASPDRSSTVFRSGNERLYEAYNDLHSLAQDFEKPFDAPAILVVGHQTDGKSGDQPHHRSLVAPTGMHLGSARSACQLSGCDRTGYSIWQQPPQPPVRHPSQKSALNLAATW